MLNAIKLSIIILFLCSPAWAQRATSLTGVPKNRDLSTEQSNQLKENLRGWIHQSAIPARNDYAGDFERGTVRYNPSMKNYSFHKVIIPDGTIVRDSNFSQRLPHTDAIQGENLTFVDCNLKNVEINPSWTLERTLTVHEEIIINP